jgi:hypothetical protein
MLHHQHNPERTRHRRLSVAALAGVLMVSSLAFMAPPAAGFGSSAPQPGPPSVNAGGYMTCGVRSDDAATCWGDNVTEGPGQANPPGGVFTEVNAGYATACGVKSDTSLACWGSSLDSGNVPPSGTGYAHVVAGFKFGCALLGTSGGIDCWGANDAGQVSNAPSGTGYSQLTVGIRHGCAIDSNGDVECWGSNTYGQTTVPAGTFSDINSGNFTVCGLASGTIVCWGRNNGGQLTVPSGSSFTQVSAGFAHACALSSGAITCWGRNTEGQSSPPTTGTYNNVSAGTFHSCAMPSSGGPAVCWGNNAAGRVQPNLSATSPPGGTVSTPYSSQLTMTTHVAPAPTYSVTAGSLPTGLTLSSGGLLSGTPTSAGTYNFTVAASNGLSPADCPVGATGTLPCTASTPGSTATGTRAYTVVIS